LYRHFTQFTYLTFFDIKDLDDVTPIQGPNRIEKICIFKPVTHHILEMVQEREIVIVESEQNVIYILSNVADY